MRHDTLRRLLTWIVGSLVCLGLAMPASAQPPPKITITVPAAWLRTEPSLVAPRSALVSHGQFYDVIGRTADNRWWLLNLPNQRAAAWLLADLGAVYAGDMEAAAVLTPTLTLPRLPARRRMSARHSTPLPVGVPSITPKHRALYRASAERGKDLGMFAVVGDCNSMPAVYLQRLATGAFDAHRLSPELQRVVQHFWRSFGRVSLAANGGLGAAAVMDPLWADGALCDVRRGETPFACELRHSRASIVFVGLGTQEQYTWREFEAHYRAIVEHALREGVLPVLVTKADDIEVFSGAPSQHINTVIRRVAREYDVPLMDFWAATRSLPNYGLVDEGDKDFHLNAAGMDLRLLLTLHTLAAILGE